jgi:hypothetical protein
MKLEELEWSAFSDLWDVARAGRVAIWRWKAPQRRAEGTYHIGVYEECQPFHENLCQVFNMDADDLELQCILLDLLARYPAGKEAA